MKEFAKKVIPEKLHPFIGSHIIKRFKKRYKKSYAQSGEDMILNTVLYNVKNGFYIDVGASDPTVHSNTHYFYQKGWSGINIDALPGSMKKFQRMRPRDINLEIPISDKRGSLKYYMFSSSSYNTFCEEIAALHKNILIGTKELETQKLSEVLDEHLNINMEIDFLSVDIEGMDYQALQSNDWNKYRPKVVVFEYKANNIKFIEESKFNMFLNEKGYTFYCCSPTNAFYIEKDFYNIRFNKELYKCENLTLYAE